MANSDEVRRRSTLRSVARALAVAGGSVGLAVLVGGWILGVSSLRSITPDAPSMKVNTAVGLILTASAILLRSGTRPPRRLVQLCAAPVILISLGTLIEDISGWNLGIDELLMADRTPPVLVTAPGRMSVDAAVALLLLGWALLLGNRLRRVVWTQLLALVAAVLGLSNLVSYLYGMRNFAGIAFYMAMAVHTSSSLLMLSLAILFSRPDSGLMAPVNRQSLGGLLTRRLLPAAVLVPVLLGWLTRQGVLHGLYVGRFGLVLFATANVVVFTYLTWTTGWRLSRIEEEKGRAVASLRAREDLLGIFVKHVPASVAMLDRDMKYLQVSDCWCVDFGLASSQMLGRSHYEMLPDIPERWKEIHRRCLAGETICSEEDRWDRADGSTVWLRWEIRPWGEHDGLPEGILIFSEDITERKRAEEALRESEQRLRWATEAAEIGAFDWNIQTGVNIWTPKLEAMYGLAPGEFGRTQPAWEQLVHPCDRAGAVAKVEETLATGEPVEHEWRILWPDGCAHWIAGRFQAFKDATGKPLRLTGVNIDITARKSYEEALRRSAEARGMERFRLSFEEAPVGMALIRGDGVWLRVNRALCQMTGYTESELIASGSDITHPDDRTEESRLLERMLSGELSTGRLEERYVHKEGHTIYVLLSMAVVERDDAGRPVHFVAHVQDLTDRKRVAQELEASRAQMVSSSRLSALGMMAGGIAHEINNPLAVIHASAANINRMAESGSMALPAVLKNSHRISQTADRISRIVRSLRHVARESTADEFRATSVREIVEEVLELCAERFRAHNIRLVVSTIDPEAVIHCREAQICQVLLNLLQNAYDELVDWEGEHWVALDVTYCGGWVAFSVTDSGPGIAPEDRAHIMEPFFTTKPMGKGVGLGLSISRSIALEHGGTLELDEESPHTCFRLKVPARTELEERYSLWN